MRLRIETAAPLPRLKTWLNVSTGRFLFGTRTFNDLCRRLVAEFGLPSDIQLQYGGFALYGKDAIESILKDDDIVQYVHTSGFEANTSVVLKGQEMKEVLTGEEKASLGKRKRDGTEGEAEDEGREEDGDSPDVKRRRGRAASVSSSSSSENEDASKSDEDESNSEESSSDDDVNAHIRGLLGFHSSSERKSEEESEESEDESEEGSDEESESESESDEYDAVKIHAKSTKPKPPARARESSSDTSLSFSSETSSASSLGDSSLDSDSDASLPPTTSKKNVVPTTPARNLVPPGQGSERTHRRNQRKTMARRLKTLISQGKLREGATFADLREYDNHNGHGNGIMHGLQETIEKVVVPETAAPGEQLRVATGVAKRIDITALQKFTTVEGDLYQMTVDDTKKETTMPVQRPQTKTPPRTLIPRKLATKSPKSLPPSASTATSSPDDVAKPDKIEDAVVSEDPLISSFYEQIGLAAEYRKSLTQQPPKINGGNLSPKPATLTIRAFECEPEWCGLADPDAEQVDSVEIDPPSLPFIDTFRHRNKKPATAKKSKKEKSIVVRGSPGVPAAPEGCDGLSEREILALEKMESPRVGTEIYFKSMFLHPSRMEPVILWRWGKLVEAMEGQKVRIQVYGPITEEREDDDDEVEAGEIIDRDVVAFTWTELLDIRLRQ
jgi:hypothetical protein